MGSSHPDKSFYLLRSGVLTLSKTKGQINDIQTLGRWTVANGNRKCPNISGTKHGLRLSCQWEEENYIAPIRAGE